MNCCIKPGTYTYCTLFPTTQTIPILTITYCVPQLVLTIEISELVRATRIPNSGQGVYNNIYTKWLPDDFAVIHTHYDSLNILIVIHFVDGMCYKKFTPVIRDVTFIYYFSDILYSRGCQEYHIE
ncbi:hypothetical protein NQ317_004002 [Molorchus minor]|uniref:Uncharacterized protein n=1 Tax=Molorchus minor TaxID=1323400 RepID=A0ABQ9IV69_9CUCU|nr:hypothetical protein NQ317_004002 [Molorchus minor]